MSSADPVLFTTTSGNERAAYIGRVRALARACCETWLAGSAA